jgi:hypothetical protein
LAVLAAGLSALLPLLVKAQSVSPGSLPDFQQRALLIMDQAVVGDPAYVNDPCHAPTAQLNPWGFGYLMKQMAATNDDAVAVAFIRDWLSQFASVPPINGQSVPRGHVDDLLKSWEANGWDLRLAPFRLLAIVNRIDLLHSPLLTGENAGELRFVFAGVIGTGQSGTCAPTRFTVNLEYGVRKSSCKDLAGWAQAWAALADSSGPPPSDPQFRMKLANLTNPITSPSQPARAKPNGSAIDHVRTNENIAGPATGPWQLREFHLTPVGKLGQTTTTLTPIASLDGSPDLDAFLASISAGFSAQPADYWIPATFPAPPNAPLLAAASSTGTTWSKLNPARPVFAMNTCGGCHGGLTDQPAHIDPVKGTISLFLQNDLNTRQSVLQSIAQKGCSVTSFGSARMVH